MRLILVFMLPELLFCRFAHADIVGGEDVHSSDPIQDSTVALYEPAPNGRGGSICTASIIGKNTAVTAAHCISRGGSHPVMIFGSDVRTSKVRREVSDASIYPTWEKYQGKGMDQGDIAVVKFEGGLPRGYRPIRTVKSDENLKRGEKTVLAGYGISNAQTHEGAGKLRKTTVEIANPRSGKSEMILDQARGHGACHGDSGGPAFVRENGKTVLAGVTNRSHPATASDDCRHRVVYTKVSAYRDWIRKKQREMSVSRRPDRFSEKMKKSKHGRKRSHRLRTRRDNVHSPASFGH